MPYVTDQNGEMYWQPEGATGGGDPGKGMYNAPPVQPATAPAPSTQPSTSDAYARLQAMLDPSAPNYVGPGYTLGYDAKGVPTLSQSSNPSDRALHDQWIANGSPKGSVQAPPVAGQPGVPSMPATPQPSQSLTPFTDRAPITSVPGRAITPTMGALPGWAGGGAPQTDSAQFTPKGFEATTDPFAARSGAQVAADSAPKIDTSKADAAISGVNSYGAQLAELANTDLGNAKALALLGDASNQAQSAAIGQARSGNIRDRAALERGAVGEVAFTGQQSARDAATLTAQQAESDRNFKASMLEKAAGLGLNVAALQVDMSKANLDSATNYINQQFQQFGLNKQLDVQQAGQILQFTRDMAAVEQQYAALDEQSKEAFLNAETQKYSVDKEYAAKMKELAKQGKINWGNVLTGMVGAAVSGGSMVAAKKILG